jgi:hypothetical protein
MRNAALILFFFVAFGYAAKSQRFTLLPQVGFENSMTKVNYNDLGSFSPAGAKFSPQASLRLNYSSKQGHGFFIGAATSRSIVAFSFTDPENGMNSFTTTPGDMQVRLEGGYQFSTKPISLGGSKQSSTTATEKRNCSHSCSHSCSRSSNKEKPISSGAGKNSWVRIQPSVGMAYIPFAENDIETNTEAGQTTYEYSAGNWKTAVMAGTGFEFGRGKTRQFTVSVNYFKAIGGLNEKTLTTVSSGKTVTTTLSSASSGWNVRVGIPFTLKAKPKAPAKPVQQQRHSGCGQYRVMYRCHGN